MSSFSCLMALDRTSNLILTGTGDRGGTEGICGPFPAQDKAVPLQCDVCCVFFCRCSFLTLRKFLFISSFLRISLRVFILFSTLLFHLQKDCSFVSSLLQESSCSALERHRISFNPHCFPALTRLCKRNIPNLSHFL